MTRLLLLLFFISPLVARAQKPVMPTSPVVEQTRTFIQKQCESEIRRNVGGRGQTPRQREAARDNYVVGCICMPELAAQWKPDPTGPSGQDAWVELFDQAETPCVARQTRRFIKDECSKSGIDCSCVESLASRMPDEVLRDEVDKAPTSGRELADHQAVIKHLATGCNAEALALWGRSGQIGVVQDPVEQAELRKPFLQSIEQHCRTARISAKVLGSPQERDSEVELWCGCMPTQIERVPAQPVHPIDVVNSTAEALAGGLEHCVVQWSRSTAAQKCRDAGGGASCGKLVPYPACANPQQAQAFNKANSQDMTRSGALLEAMGHYGEAVNRADSVLDRFKPFASAEEFESRRTAVYGGADAVTWFEAAKKTIGQLNTRYVTRSYVQDNQKDPAESERRQCEITSETFDYMKNLGTVADKYAKIMTANAEKLEVELATLKSKK